MSNSNYSWVAKNWRDMIRPQSIRPDDDSMTRSYGKFICEPLERGFGITLGNSLRRIMLSSLQGAAVTAVKIDGVVHEFSSIPNVVEDVTDMILNIKGVRFRKPNPKPVILNLNITGPARVTASDIELVDDMEIVNPNHHICTISEGGHLRMQLSVRTGKGYISAEIHKDSTLGVGSIPVDGIYSPIRKVNYTVSNARVGRRTDYDKLVLEIWTDGTIHPKDALSFSAKIMKEHLQIFISFDEQDEPVDDGEGSSESEINQFLFKSVDELELSVRSANCLQNANIKYIGQLVQKSEQEMLKTKNFGRKSLKEIKEILSEMGLTLGMKIDWWPADGPPPKGAGAPKK
ncbi:MAG: DNA-directed RNA polymerase subunit alpha [Deltaproteobacteria bacterium]|nr:DNA-directed RNA polymerase subunit alpha [Deltaproteobacteria bacterium]